MPVETEDKYVLNPTQELFDRFKAEYYPPFHITQFYVSDAARYRRILPNGNGFGAVWLFTHKLVVEGEVLEQEMPVEQADYTLASKVALGTLYKIRFECQGISAGAKWDVDFFFDGPHGTGQLYFAMAECEHTRGHDYQMLPAISDAILYAVPRDEGKLYSNRRLTDVAYTRGLLAKLKGG